MTKSPFSKNDFYWTTNRKIRSKNVAGISVRTDIFCFALLALNSFHLKDKSSFLFPNESQKKFHFTLKTKVTLIRKWISTRISYSQFNLFCQKYSKKESQQYCHEHEYKIFHLNPHFSQSKVSKLVEQIFFLSLKMRFVVTDQAYSIWYKRSNEWIRTDTR